MANESLMSKLWRYYTTLLDWQFGCKNFAISDYHCTKLHKKCRVANLLRSLTANNLSSSKEAGEALTTAIAAVADTRKMTRSNITIIRSELIKLWVASTRTVNVLQVEMSCACTSGQVQLPHKFHFSEKYTLRLNLASYTCIMYLQSTLDSEEQTNKCNLDHMSRVTTCQTDTNCSNTLDNPMAANASPRSSTSHTSKLPVRESLDEISRSHRTFAILSLQGLPFESTSTLQVRSRFSKVFTGWWWELSEQEEATMSRILRCPTTRRHHRPSSAVQDLRRKSKV